MRDLLAFPLIFIASIIDVIALFFWEIGVRIGGKKVAEVALDRFKNDIKK